MDRLEPGFSLTFGKRDNSSLRHRARATCLPRLQLTCKRDNPRLHRDWAWCLPGLQLIRSPTLSDGANSFCRRSSLANVTIPDSRLRLSRWLGAAARCRRHVERQVAWDDGFGRLGAKAEAAQVSFWALARGPAGPLDLLLGALGYGSKLRHQTAGFSPCFHLPGFHLGYLFLTHSHLCEW